MATPNLKITARSVLFLIAPSNKGAFQIRLGLQTNDEKLQAMGDFTINNCVDIRDGVQKTKLLIEDMNLDYASDFTLVLPLFTAKNDEEEATLINNAWLIKEAADEQGWLFSRIIPTPLF